MPQYLAHQRGKGKKQGKEIGVISDIGWNAIDSGRAEAPPI
jgi:hypothetical protein